MVADLTGLFAALEAAGGEPVVLRSWEGLPRRVDGDVDVLLHPEALGAVGRELRGRGFKAKRGRGRRISGATPHWKFDRSDGLRLDVVERLCYRSPYDRRHPWVAAHPRLTEWMRARRRLHESAAFHVPSDADLFAHLLCHCTFDKRDFEPQYREQLTRLAAGSSDEQLGPVLELCYFRVWPGVLELVRAGDFDRLTDLRWMTGY